MAFGSLDIPRDKILVEVQTTNGRGFTPQELAAQCVKKIVSVSDQAHPAIREQAHAFSLNIQEIIVDYMKQAVLSDRTTVCNALNDAGHPELAQLIRKL